MKEDVLRRAGLTSVVRRGGWEMAGLPKLDSISQVRSLSLSPESLKKYLRRIQILTLLLFFVLQDQLVFNAPENSAIQPMLHENV